MFESRIKEQKMMSHTVRFGRLSLMLVLMGAGTLWADWPHWRGANQLGTSPETDLPSTWSPQGENLMWQVPVGCRSTPLIMNGRVYLISRAGEGQSRQERVIALDLDTGRTLWEHRFNAFLTDVVFHRLGWTNLAGDPGTGYIYAHGVQGMFFCLDRDGKVIWQHSLTEELGRISGYGGRTISPILEGDEVIISSLTSGWGSHGPAAHRFYGLDKRTGVIKWVTPAGERPLVTTYSVPVTTTLDGARVMFTGLADGSIAALRPTTGETLWRFPFSRVGIMSSVVYDRGRVYAVQGETNVDTGNMGRLVCLDARRGTEIWRVDGLTGQYSSPALHDGLIYVANNAANLFCVDAVTGEVYWDFNYGNEAKGSPVVADGKIYVSDVPGGWAILEANREGCSLLSKQRFFRDGDAPDEVYATAAVAHGRVTLSTMTRTFCISKKRPGYRSPGTDAVFGPADKIVAGKAVTIRVEPAEVVMAPGDEVTFVAQGFDAKGTATGRVRASFTSAGLAGELGPRGGFRAAGTRIQAGLVTATSGDMKAAARVRIVPRLPYVENFDDIAIGAAPAGWITSPLKAKVVEHEGEKVLLKTADRPSPAFGRLRCYMMPPIEAGYTVQSDMLGKVNKRRKLPDMGLINSRYLLVLTGTSETTRKLRLVTWAVIPRVIKEIEFPWKADTWYTSKLSVNIVHGKAQIAAKVWSRGEPEPQAWSLTMDDATPNLAGSPGLYAYAVSITEKSKGTEVLFDNVSITPNP